MIFLFSAEFILCVLIHRFWLVGFSSKALSHRTQWRTHELFLMWPLSSSIIIFIPNHFKFWWIGVDRTNPDVGHLSWYYFSLQLNRRSADSLSIGSKPNWERADRSRFGPVLCIGERPPWKNPNEEERRIKVWQFYPERVWCIRWEVEGPFYFSRLENIKVEKCGNFFTTLLLIKSKQQETFIGRQEPRPIVSKCTRFLRISGQDASHLKFETFIPEFYVQEEVIRIWNNEYSVIGTHGIFL